MLSFDDVNVLANAGSAYQRFAAHVEPNVPSYGPAVGRLVFIQTLDDSVPQLAAVFVPAGLDVLAPVPMHVFFCPNTGGKKRPYPFSNGTDSFNGVLHNYLTGGDKRLINQHAAARVRCVLVFPLPPPTGYFSGIQDAKRLRRYCLEVVFLLQRLAGYHMPIPLLGRCALSAFSEGGIPLHNVVRSSPDGSAFPELKEIYLLDVVAPCGNTTSLGSYQTLLQTLNGWHRCDSERRVRTYTQYSAFNACVPGGVKPAVSRTNAGASDASASSADCTFLFAPISFWKVVKQEQQGVSPNPSYVLGGLDGQAKDQERTVHQLMPCIFLEHALKNSGFSKG